MISTDSKNRAATAANRIVSTAPMAKFGAMMTPDLGLGRRASAARWPAARSSKPVVPTTAWMPWSMQKRMLLHHRVRVGEVDHDLRAGVGQPANSQSPDVRPRPPDRGRRRRRPPGRPREPIRPRAPITPTRSGLVASCAPAPFLTSTSAWHASRCGRPVSPSAGQLRDSTGRSSVDANGPDHGQAVSGRPAASAGHRARRRPAVTASMPVQHLVDGRAARRTTSSPLPIRLIRDSDVLQAEHQTTPRELALGRGDLRVGDAVSADRPRARCRTSSSTWSTLAGRQPA